MNLKVEYLYLVDTKQPRRIFTIAYVITDEGIIYAASCCNPNDIFSKKVGRELAAQSLHISLVLDDYRLFTMAEFLEVAYGYDTMIVLPEVAAELTFRDYTTDFFLFIFETLLQEKYEDLANTMNRAMYQEVESDE